MKKEYVLQFFLSAVLAGALFFLSLMVYVRVDVTPKKIYTLSSYTKNLFQMLDEQVAITWFKSYRVDVYVPTVHYVSDFLFEYEQNKNCLVRIKNADAISAKVLADIGAQPRQIERQTKNKKVIETLYSVVLVEYKGQSRSIPFVSDVSRLEYDIARFISDMQHIADGGSKKMVSVLADPETVLTQYNYLLSWLTYSGFIPQIVTEKEPHLNPEDPLLVLGSVYADIHTVAAIESFLRAGGNAVFFVSGNTVDIDGAWTAVPKNGDAVLNLLAEFGFYVQENLVTDENNFRMALPDPQSGITTYIDYPFWVRAGVSQVHREHVLFSGFQDLQFFWPSSLVVNPTAAPGVSMLVTTSRSAAVHIDDYDTNPFLEQEKKVPAETREAVGLVAVSEEFGRMVVCSDEYFPSRLIEYTHSDFNLDFIINCLEWVDRRDTLLVLKDKTAFAEPFTEFSDQAVFLTYVRRARIINIIVVPLVLIGYMVWLIARKRRRREKV